VVDVVQVKGRKSDTRIVELLAARKEATDSQLELENYTCQWQNCFTQGNIAGALFAIKTVLRIPEYSQDHALHMIQKRCQYLIEHPEEYEESFKFSEKDF
jgi:hypothetical protein